jgi:hypothetical protein
MSDSVLMYGRHSVDSGALAVSVAVTAVLCAAFLGGTLFAMTAKRMDNTADEVF